MNPDYKPDEIDEEIISVFKKEFRVNPLRIRELTGIRKQYVNDSLRDLKNAGWITKINRGLYEWNGDPRDDPTHAVDDSANPNRPVVGTDTIGESGQRSQSDAASGHSEE